MLGCGDATLGDYTAEALRSRSKEFLIRNYFELCASVVKVSSQKTQKNPMKRREQSFGTSNFR
jgi:hypothetical protein